MEAVFLMSDEFSALRVIYFERSLVKTIFMGINLIFFFALCHVLSEEMVGCNWEQF